ncbi:MAG: hypothetical protein IJY61_08730 [Candidatus Gastranaerophilales bacterium]|nr:hypothetical protein [Candidatus Gastranaerophilales bacterium]
MIVILGVENEAHAKRVATYLQAKGEEYIFLDTQNYPNSIFLDWEATERNKGNITINNKKIPLSDIKSAYWRNFSDVKYEHFEDGENSEFLSSMLERERRSALHSFFYSLDTNWVNSMHAFDLHKKKAFLTSEFKKNGIRVPKTLITNDKDALIRFYEENDKNIIYKPVLGGAYTQKITDESLTDEQLATLKVSPVQFQEFVDGVDIRVYAFKNTLYSAIIEASTIDFREDMESKLIPVDLPKKVQEDCFKMMKIADLKYSGIDIRLSNKGEYVFIEANPAPMFIHAERVTGFPLTEELIKLLLS